MYPFGFDPVWFKSDQLLTFTNNFKMKLAVIFAIIQMSLGIVLKGLNSLHFRNRLDFFFEFIPQILLLFSLFGWMDILIIAKWTEHKNIEDIRLSDCPDISLPAAERQLLYDKYNEVHRSPAIISTMIDIFLNGASNSLKGEIKCKDVKSDEYNYVLGGQQGMSIVFLLIAFICVPTMLIVKPMILKKRLAEEHRKSEAGDGVEVKAERIQYESSNGNSNESLKNSKNLGDERMEQIA